MWVSPVLQPERRRRASVADRQRRRRTPAVDLARQQHAPLDPRVLQHVERARQVPADRVPHAARPSTTTLSKECSSPTHELLEEHRLVGASAGRRASHVVELVGVVDAERVARARRRPAAWRRTGSRRSATNADARRRPTAARRAAGARHAGGLEGGLHPRLVAEVVGDADAACRGCRAARAPRRAAPGGSRGWRRGGPPTRGARRIVGRAVGRAGRGRGSRRVRQCPAMARRTVGGKASTGSLLISPTRASGTWATASTNRVGRLHRVRRHEHHVRHTRRTVLAAWTRRCRAARSASDREDHGVSRCRSAWEQRSPRARWPLR